MKKPETKWLWDVFSLAPLPNRWLSHEQQKKIICLYPSAPKEELLSIFPHQTWKAISAHAYRLGIKRSRQKKGVNLWSQWLLEMQRFIVAIAWRYCPRLARLIQCLLYNGDMIKKQLPGLSKYLIRSDGEIESLWFEPKILEGGTDKDGYKKFVLIDDMGCRRYVRRASLVCCAFHGPRPAKMTVRHKDGTRTNDCESNLGWATQSVNCRDKIEHGTHQKGSKNGNSKITEDDARRIKAMAGTPALEVAELIGCTKNIVNNIRYGKSWAWISA